MFKAFEIPSDEDLTQFSRLLWQRKISHRVYSEGSLEFLAVAKLEDIAETNHLYLQWKNGTLVPSEQNSTGIAGYINPGNSIKRFSDALSHYPLTILLIFVCCVLAIVVPLDSLSSTTRLLLYPDFAFGTRTVNLNRVIENFNYAQFLRMISPILLHAGLLHLTFNMLWLWEFGRRIESRQRSISMVILVIVLALVSNTAQYLNSGSILFGGMSGVIAGLFSYIWMWQLFDPAKGLNLPKNIVFFMLAMLLLMAVIDLESIADTAHLAGLLAGVVYGASVATISRVTRSLKSSPL